MVCAVETAKLWIPGPSHSKLMRIPGGCHLKKRKGILPSHYNARCCARIPHYYSPRRFISYGISNKYHGILLRLEFISRLAFDLFTFVWIPRAEIAPKCDKLECLNCIERFEASASYISLYRRFGC